KANPLDKRLVDVTIAAQGLAVLERLDAINHELDSVVSNQLSEQECEQLSSLLDKMRGNNTKRRLVS
ncbi:MAG TPA: MarR family transcriptional regulator, partial [Chitinophagaceae bacterium]|nr:MarR family transcriptional regulator [Chitinophagaceae bacterium]